MAYRDKKFVVVFVRFSCAASPKLISFNTQSKFIDLLKQGLTHLHFNKNPSKGSVLKSTLIAIIL
jgi:hypothetical protein